MDQKEIAARATALKPKIMALIEKHRVRWDDPANWGREKEILRDLTAELAQLICEAVTKDVFDQAFRHPEVQLLFKDLAGRSSGKG